MIINFLGDSITMGVGATSHDLCFVSLLKKKFPQHEILNQGISGTRIARQDEIYNPKNYVLLDCDSYSFNLDFNVRIPNLKRNSDYVFVFGGTNDWGHGSAPFGNLSDDTPYTYCGAVRKLFTELSKKFGKDKVKVIIPLYRFDDWHKKGGDSDWLPHSDKMLTDYCDVQISICNELGIEYLDYRNELGHPNNDKNEGYFKDGLHPNDKGHQLLADLLSKVIEKFC